MSIQEFAQALERGEVAAEIARLRDLPEPAVFRAEEDEDIITAALWPQWYARNREI